MACERNRRLASCRRSRRPLFDGRWQGTTTLSVIVDDGWFRAALLLRILGQYYCVFCVRRGYRVRLFSAAPSLCPWSLRALRQSISAIAPQCVTGPLPGFCQIGSRSTAPADELPAVPAEPRRAQVDWRRQHDVRPRQIPQCGQPVPVPWLKPKGRAGASSGCVSQWMRRNFPGEPDTEQLPRWTNISVAPCCRPRIDHRLSARRAL